jgi:DNA-directed RNA polymerase subunit beta'
MDRFFVQDVPGVGRRNELVTAELVAKARAKKLEKLPVRSALTCEAEGGVCQKCYGLMANGQLARIGENVGVIDSEALTERSTQLTMQAFHTGGAGKASSVSAGFPRLEELLHIPEKIRNAAVLARADGTVTGINENPAGGKNLFIGSEQYYIPRERDLTVAIGSSVKRGDRLTDGSIRPQDLSNLKDHLTAQQYVADEINKIYDNKFARKTFETVLRGVSNNAEILHIPEESEDKVDFMRGDTVHLTRVKRINRELAEEGKAPIEYKPYFKSIDVLPLKSNDWLSRLTTNRLVQTIQEAASTGQEASIKGTDPMSAYLYGLEFGKDIKPKKREFY